VNPTRSRTALAAAAAIVALAGTANARAAAVEPPDPQPVPPGYRWVEDDTGTIGVAIPADWTVTNTAAFELGKAPSPVISASSPGEASLAFWAEPSSGPPQPWDPATCDPMVTECSTVLASAAYDDGSFVGYRQTIEECCAGGPYDTVGAVARDGSLTVYLTFDYGESRRPSDVAIFDTMLGTVARVGAPLPAIPPLTHPVFPYDDFYSVPRLGSEPVRGTGCGASGQIGDVIPDGIWAGFAGVDGDRVSVDLVCVFTPEAAERVLAEGTAAIIYPDPAYLIVNNNQRERTVPAAPTLELRDAQWNEQSRCVEGSYIEAADHRDFQAWVTIEGGVATSIVWGCERIVDEDAEAAE
jgi:hypothetical protein